MLLHNNPDITAVVTCYSCTTKIEHLDDKVCPLHSNYYSVLVHVFVITSKPGFLFQLVAMFSKTVRENLEWKAWILKAMLVTL